MEHLFGNVLGELEKIRITPLYKIVGKEFGKEGYEELDTAKTKEEAERLVEEYKSAYKFKWDIIYYNVQD